MWSSARWASAPATRPRSATTARRSSFGHEPGGGVAPNCQTTSSTAEQVAVHPERRDRRRRSRRSMMPRAQDSTENCTWHNFNTVPTKGGNFLVSGNYQAGINVIDFTQPAAPKVIAYADPKPLPSTTTYGGDGYPDGGDWSTYWYNGKIYEADIYRGLMSGTSTTRSPTARTRSRTRTRRRRSARSRPTTPPRRSRRPTRAPATCRARPSRPRSRAPTRAWARYARVVRSVNSSMSSRPSPTAWRRMATVSSRSASDARMRSAMRAPG